VLEKSNVAQNFKLIAIIEILVDRFCSAINLPKILGSKIEALIKKLMFYSKIKMRLKNRNFIKLLEKILIKNRNYSRNSSVDLVNSSFWSKKQIRQFFRRAQTFVQN